MESVKNTPSGLEPSLREDIKVRQAVLSDLDLIASLFDEYRQFYGRSTDIAASRAFLLDRFNHGESVLFIACSGAVPVGFTQLYPSFSSVSLARTFILNDLFVSAEARKKGTATMLMHAAVNFAKSVDAVRISLSTSVSNQTAQAVYESLGWKKDEQFYHYHFAIVL